MLNILVISDEATDIYALFKAEGFTPDIRGLKHEPVDPEREGGDAVHDLAFLDLDTINWQERLLDIRHSMPVIAFSHSNLKKAVESLHNEFKLGE